MEGRKERREGGRREEERRRGSVRQLSSCGKNRFSGDFPVVQWLGVPTSNAGVEGLTPGQVTGFLHALWRGKKIKIKK